MNDTDQGGKLDCGAFSRGPVGPMGRAGYGLSGDRPSWGILENLTGTGIEKKIKTCTL
jgi:hypothetical protein